MRWFPLGWWPWFPRWVCVCACVLLFVATVAADSPQVFSPRSALVSVNRRCSGVCVHPDGWIVSAAHCFDWPKVSESRPAIPGLSPFRMIPVQFDGQDEIRAELRYLAHYEQQTDIAILKVPGGQGLPYVRLSSFPPEIGDQVYSLGYPAGKFSLTESQIVSRGLVSVNERGATAGILNPSVALQAIGTDSYVNAGNSGGPLLNSRHELVGIATHGYQDPDSQKPKPAALWADWQSIRTALQTAGVDPEAIPVQTPDKRPRMLVFLSENCAPCKLWKTDYAAGTTAFGRQINGLCEVQEGNASHPNFGDLVAKYQVDTFPTFILLDGQQVLERVVNYPGKQGLLDRIARHTLPLRAVPTPPSNPRIVEPLPRDPPQQFTADDLAAIEVAVLIGQVKTSSWGDTALTVAERRLKGPLERRIHEKLGGKVQVHLIFERIEPTRFSELAEVAGLDDEGRGSILVLCRKQFGGIKGLLADKASAILQDFGSSRLKGLPITLLFERLAGDEASFVQAMRVLRSPPEAPLDQPLVVGGAGGIVALLGALWNRLKGRKARPA